MFQYILCVGSSGICTIFVELKIVSIHPMCRFKTLSCEFEKLANGFQYILCVGSRIPVLVQIYLQASFNTSYVSVQES